MLSGAIKKLVLPATAAASAAAADLEDEEGQFKRTLGSPQSRSLVLGGGEYLKDLSTGKS